MFQFTMPYQFRIRRIKRERHYAHRRIDFTLPHPNDNIHISVQKSKRNWDTYKHIRHLSVLPTVSYTSCICCIPILRLGVKGVLGSSSGASSSSSFGPVAAGSCGRVGDVLSTDAGVGIGVGAGVGVRSSIFRRFGSAFSDSSSSSLLCLRLVGDDDEDTDDDDESVPGAEAEDATLGVGVRGRGSVVVIVVVVGSGAGVGGVGEDADEGVLSSSTTIGGGVGAVDIFLVDAAAAPHVHLSMNCPKPELLAQTRLQQTNRAFYLRQFYKFSLEVHAHPPLRLIISHTCAKHFLSDIPTRQRKRFLTHIVSAHSAKYVAPAWPAYAPPVSAAKAP